MSELRLGVAPLLGAGEVMAGPDQLGVVTFVAQLHSLFCRHTEGGAGIYILCLRLQP